VHVSAAVLVGAGGVRLDVASSLDAPEDAFLVAEPELGLELDVARRVRVAAGASYRFVRGARIHAATDAELRGVAGTLALKLGHF
jgi:hypothetical protein